MDLAAVEFLLQTLNRLRQHRPHLISAAIHPIQSLETNLLLFRSFLKATAEHPFQNLETHPSFQDLETHPAFHRHRSFRKATPELMEGVILVEKIRLAVFEAEDAIEAYVSQATDKQTENYFQRAFEAAPEKLVKAVGEVEAVGKAVKQIIKERQIDMTETCETAVGVKLPPQNYKVSNTWEHNVVGLEDEAEKIIGFMSRVTEELEAISIVGTAGLGKTTLARKLFGDTRLESLFLAKIWVHVSREFRKRDIFLGILRDLNWMTEDMLNKTDVDIAQLLKDCLEKEKFLIVLDDLWNGYAWDDLKVAFPMTNNTSKILITTRNYAVARYVNISLQPHKLRKLTEDESWELLKSLTFGKLKVPPKLEGLGYFIARHCEGWPLGIMLIGGILKKSSPGDVNLIRSTWEKVSERLQVSSRNDDLEDRAKAIISMSYGALPFYLKPFFVFMGLFPEDFEIPIHRLLLLWIAEGFIQQQTGTSLEETAMQYLEDLISRNLFVVHKVSPAGNIKTCRMHDLIRDRALLEGQTYFIHEMSFSRHIGFDLEWYRRTSIQFNVESFISSQPYNPYVRTFLHCSTEDVILPPEDVSFIPDSFKLMRVLEAKPLLLTRFPFFLTQLIHLRYVTLSSDFKVIPEEISKLWNVQSLIIRTTSRKLLVKANIWKFIYLRHLETNASMTLQKAGEGGDGKNIQTLFHVSPLNCTEIFEKARNLKKLGIRGLLTVLLDDEDEMCSFNGLETLYQLETLKLLNDQHIDPDKAKLSRLPPPSNFPTKLTSLTLSYTLLDWDNMSILEKLENLKVLKLKNDAFVGECWEVGAGFQQLEVLRIRYADLAMWKALSHHFPKLEHLTLRNCEELRALPLGLAEVSSLREVNLYRTTKLAADSARKIRDTIQETKEGTKIKLSILLLDD